MCLGCGAGGRHICTAMDGILEFLEMAAYQILRWNQSTVLNLRQVVVSNITTDAVPSVTALFCGHGKSPIAWVRVDMVGSTCGLGGDTTHARVSCVWRDGCVGPTAGYNGPAHERVFYRQSAVAVEVSRIATALSLHVVLTGAVFRCAICFEMLDTSLRDTDHFKCALTHPDGPCVSCAVQCGCCPMCKGVRGSPSAPPVVGGAYARLHLY